MQPQGTRSPQSGDTLILTDGRRFVMDSAEQASRGWWFKARAQDGTCVLQGNLRLRWDQRANAWYPEDGSEEIPSPPPLPPSMQRSSQPRAKQID